jgi:tryptophan-rich sensory protein
MKNSVWVHVLTPVVSALLMNGFIYGSGIRQTSANKNPYIPAGYIVGGIWTVLFGLLGYTHYLLPEGSVARWSIVGFIVFSLLYPIFTGLDARRGLLLNLISLVFAFVITILVAIESTKIVYYMIPLLAWIIYVNGVFVVECAEKYV